MGDSSRKLEEAHHIIRQQHKWPYAEKRPAALALLTHRENEEPNTSHNTAKWKWMKRRRRAFVYHFRIKVATISSLSIYCVSINCSVQLCFVFFTCWMFASVVAYFVRIWSKIFMKYLNLNTHTDSTNDNSVCFLLESCQQIKATTFVVHTAINKQQEYTAFAFLCVVFLLWFLFKLQFFSCARWFVTVQLMEVNLLWTQCKLIIFRLFSKNFHLFSLMCGMIFVWPTIKGHFNDNSTKIHLKVVMKFSEYKHR